MPGGTPSEKRPATYARLQPEVGDTEQRDRHDGARHRQRHRQREREEWRQAEGQHEGPPGGRAQARVERCAVPYLVALALTLAIEVPVVTIALGSLGVERRRAALLALVANLLTHPVFGLVVARWIESPLGLGLAEVAVVVVETGVYVWGSKGAATVGPAMAVAALANGLSLAIGLAVLLVLD